MGQTLGVGIIVKDEKDTIGPCIESIAQVADQIVVVKQADTTQATIDAIKAASDKVELYDFEWVKDFSAKRNFCFSKLKTDWMLWVDADDTVYQAENLRRLIDNIRPEVGAIWFPYHYAVDEYGNVTTEYERERLLRSCYGWVWKGRIHETIQPLQECKFVRSDQVIIVHNHKAGESRETRNFEILNIMHKENPEDKRIWLYLGHQHFAGRNFVEAAQWYLKFGQDTGAVPIERYQALCYACRAMREIKNAQGVDVALMALDLFPQYKDAYLELAHTYLDMGEWDKAIHFAKLVENKELMKEPPSLIFINPLDYTFNRYALLAECYLKKGEYQTALEWMLKAQEIRPTEDVKRNLLMLNTIIHRARVVETYQVQAVEHLNNNEPAKLVDLLNSTPYWFRDTDEFKTLVAGVEHYTKDIKDNPAITEGANKDEAVVNLACALQPEELLAEIDKKYKRVTVIAPLPVKDVPQYKVYSFRDMERILTSSPGRHIVQLQQDEHRIFAHYDHKLPWDNPNSLSVRFYLGPGLEHWTPKTIEEIGCGGSETSAAWLAREFARKDCQSVIYAMDNQVWDGVVYRPYTIFRPEQDCHLFISSRVPDIFNHPIPAKQKWLWMHDIACWDRLTPDIAQKLNAIIVLSHWHADHIKRVYPWLKEAEVIDLDDCDKTYDDDWTCGVFYEGETITRLPKIVICGDAIDVKRFKGLKETRVPHRFIWCSSPDRGLEEVLQMWPLIKEKMPDATMRIFYGWEYFDTSLHIPAQREMKGRLLKLLKQDGVTWCGRVGQDQLARELAQADIMLYPPPHPFRETYGIAFLEAQASGVVVFYRENGALGETVGDRGVPLAMNLTKEAIVTRIVEVISDPKTSGKIRYKGMKYALARDWGKQAEKLLALYRRLEDGSDNSSQSHIEKLKRLNH